MPPWVSPASAPDERLLDERLVLAWRPEQGRVALISISPREIMGMVGAESRFLAPWVIFALRTGQVYHSPPDRVTQQVVDRLVVELLALAPAGLAPRVPLEERLQLVQSSTEMSEARFLITLLKTGGLGETTRQAGALGEPLESLAAKVGEELADFLRRPGHEDHRPLLGELTPAEKQAVGILQKVARAQ